MPKRKIRKPNFKSILGHTLFKCQEYSRRLGIYAKEIKERILFIMRHHIIELYGLGIYWLIRFVIPAHTSILAYEDICLFSRLFWFSRMSTIIKMASPWTSSTTSSTQSQNQSVSNIISDIQDKPIYPTQPKNLQNFMLLIYHLRTCSNTKYKPDTKYNCLNTCSKEPNTKYNLQLLTHVQTPYTKYNEYWYIHLQFYLLRTIAVVTIGMCPTCFTRGVFSLVVL